MQTLFNNGKSELSLLSEIADRTPTSDLAVLLAS
jgi:hypothetical protein